jgi:hypothetical protein
MLQYTYHYIKDMEFSGVFDASFNSKKSGNNSIYLKYFLFIKYGNLVYIDIKSVGSIIIPFEELMKHKHLKMYYEISIMLIDNKHQIIEKKSEDDRYEARYNKSIYKEERDWFIDSAYFIEDFSTKIKRVETGKYYHYYDINPNDLRNMDVSSATDIARFFEVLKIRYGYEQGKIFKKIFENYTNLLLEYNINLVEKGVEEISASHEDDKNFFNLLELNNKKGMNADLFNILYNLLISTKTQKRFAHFIKF